MTVGIVTSASDIAAILDTVAPDAGTPLADTPVWDELAPRWAQMQEKFRTWESQVQPIQVVDRTGTPKPRPPKTPRTGPKSGSAGSSTRRAANAPQAPTETASVGKSEAEPEEASS